MEKKQSKNIDEKYIEMVKRFKKEPKVRNIKRVKMLLDFIYWYRRHRDILSEDERDYLQSNIYRVDKDNEYQDEIPQKDPWD